MHPWRTLIAQKPGAASVRFHALARRFRRKECPFGFTLLEVLVSIAILAMLMALVATIFNSSSRLWKAAETKVSAFQSARAAVETISRRLGQATLNSYIDYERDASGNIQNSTGDSEKRIAYVRQSNLHFLCGPPEGFGYYEMTDLLQCHSHAVFFEAPLGYAGNSTITQGMNSALNVCGYFVEFSADSGSRASFLSTTAKPRWRYRLMEVRQATEGLGVYASTFNYATGTPLPYSLTWLTTDLGLTTAERPQRVLAENVIAMVLLPRLSFSDPRYAATYLTDNFVYNSRLYLDKTGGSYRAKTRNALPPVMQLILVVIDESSALRLADEYGNIAPFGPTSNMPVSGLFNHPDNLEGDIETLTKYLKENRINYRLFSSDILIRNAREVL
ncbi:MAG: Verru_Chthon cassette protein C [Verrucomicrobiae bacterium]